MQKYPFFNYLFVDEDLQKEFEEVIEKNDFFDFFTMYQHVGTNFTVSYVDAKSVVNGGGYFQTLMDYRKIYDPSDFARPSEVTTSRNTNLTVLRKRQRTFSGYIRSIRALIRTYKRQEASNVRNDTWNIVWYSDYKKEATGIR